MATNWFSAAAPVMRRVRAYFAPVNRAAQAPVIFDPSQQAAPQAPVRTASGSGPAFCVRSCDGRYFPLSRNNASPVALCQAFCPASPTKVFFGSNIDGATTSDKLLHLKKRPARIAVRVGKQAKIAVI